MKKSNLTEFMDGNYIQSPSDYFATSKQNIRKLKESQTVHEHRALRWLDLGHEEYPSKILELDSTQSIGDFSLVREGFKRTNFTPVKKNKDFSGFKV
jgi:hypothetical protein